MAFKILLFSSFLTLANVISAENVTLGNISEGKLLYHEIFERIPKPDVTETAIGTINIKDGVITAIDVQDLQGNGRSNILCGGIGENKTKIALIGKRGAGFKFIIDVYGKPGDKLSKLNDSSENKPNISDKPKVKSENPDKTSKDKLQKDDEASKGKLKGTDETKKKDKSDKPADKPQKVKLIYRNHSTDEPSKDKPANHKNTSQKPSNALKLVYSPYEA